MNVKDVNYDAKSFSVIIILFLIVGFLGFIIGDSKHNNPVVENPCIDSVELNNKVIIVEVEHLDSIKNEKIIEVKTLDNDSTLKLFYQLLRK